MNQNSRTDDPKSEPCYDIHLYHGGKFGIEGKKTERCPDGVEYVGGKLRLIRRVKVKDLTYWFIYGVLRELTETGVVAFLWYIKVGQPMGSRCLVCGDGDMKRVVNTADENNRIKLYVTYSPKITTKTPLTLSPDFKRSKLRCGPPQISHSQKKPTQPKSLIHTKKAFTDLSKNPKIINKFSSILAAFDDPSVDNNLLCFEPQKVQKIPFRKSGIVIKDLEGEGNTHVVGVQRDSYIGKGKEICEEIDVSESLRKKKLCSAGLVKESSVVCSVAGSEHGLKENEVVVVRGNKGKSVSKSVSEDGVSKSVSKGTKQKRQMGLKTVANRKSNKNGRGKKRKKGLIFEDERDFDMSEDSEYSDLDIEFEIGEDDRREDEVFEMDDDGSILRGVENTLRLGKMKALTAAGDEESVFTDCESDSDDLKSLDGSDEELGNIQNYPVFKEDFTKNVTLSLGLKFSTRLVLRKALVCHAIEGRYDYYYLHSGRKRVTTYCRNRCECPWSSKKCKIKCKCQNWKCFFKIHAKKLNDESTFQIKCLNLRHTCTRNGFSRKISSEYLADRYLEEWRDNPTWNLKAFQKRVKRDLGFAITGSIAYLARSRIRLMINDDEADQYSRVWDYVAAVRKFNRGSSAIVVVDNIERPPPIFQRMYICLKACKEGWLSGCRPIVGVDGCHLRGQFPGMCLVAVGMDGNNNIYPIAWGVVDVENASTWSWFLRLLIEDLDKEDGAGLTFMSDRQKGLLDAFAIVSPKAEIRYCARHIWANFKLRFSGEAYKEAFWKAARCTTKVEFDAQMDEIKCMNPNAHSYLVAIPPKHWSRHAFSTSCKSNMLLNNMCESFNHVIKEAREKPILTHMEWMRRYVMKRMSDKREGVKSVLGKLMPYVVKYLKWADDQSRFCCITQSSPNVFEVDWRGDGFVVDLNKKECTCFQWQLSGLPCPHATGCINEKRAHIEDYIDVAYTKETYSLAYKPCVSPMPGVRHWDRVEKQVDPLPPIFKKLPGRPNSKKRRKEAGEGTSKQRKTVSMSRACGNCGQLGHNVKTCKNGKVTANQNPATKPLNKSAWSTKRREATAKAKVAKDRLKDTSFVSSMQGTSAVPVSATGHGPYTSQAHSTVPRGEGDAFGGSQASVTQGVNKKGRKT